MDTNTKNITIKTQDISTTEKDKSATENTWTPEKANALAAELLKDFPSVRGTGSVIWPVRKR